MKRTADAKGITKGFLYALISLIVMIIFALVFFIIISFVVKWTGDLVFGAHNWNTDAALIASAILSAGVLIGGAYGGTYE